MEQSDIGMTSMLCCRFAKLNLYFGRSYEYPIMGL